MTHRMCGGEEIAFLKKRSQGCGISLILLGILVGLGTGGWGLEALCSFSYGYHGGGAWERAGRHKLLVWIGFCLATRREQDYFGVCSANQVDHFRGILPFQILVAFEIHGPGWRPRR